jgi:hypothetical protein
VSTEFRMPPERDLPLGRLPQRREHLVKELIRTEHEITEHTQPPRRRRWLPLVLAPAAILLAGAAYAIIARPAEEVVGGVYCYAATSPGADTTIVSADGRDPVEICAELWEEGVVAPEATEAPPLVACVGSQDQAVSVYPGREGTCEKLGLGPLPLGYLRAAVRFAPMREEMYRRVYAHDCLRNPRARQIVREVLDDHGFTDWVIEGPASVGWRVGDPDPCLTVAFEPARRAVILLGSVEG